MKNSLLILFLLLSLAITALGQSVPSYVPTNGLVGWWPFNGNANDESGNGNNGTIYGAGLAVDRFGESAKCYDFNYIGMSWSSVLHQVINIPFSPIYNSSQITVSVWYNARNYFFSGIPGSDKNAALVYRFQDGYSNPNGQTWGIYLQQNTVNAFVLPSATQNYQIGMSITCNTNLNQWNNVVFTFDSQWFKLYHNGVLASQSPTTISLNTLGNSGISFGCSNQANGYWYESDALIDDIGIWNRSISAAEVAQLYSAQSVNQPNHTANTITSTLPTGISYQAVSRDSVGQPLANRNATVRFTLRDSSITGTAVYVETHAVTTNSLGLFTAVIGGGNATTGTYSAVNWMGPQKFLSVEMDSGNGFQLIGSQQLLSVPYSNVAGKSLESLSIKNASLPVFSGNAAAVSGGLQPGDTYRTPTGILMIVY